MALAKWTDALSVHIEQFDNEHKQLIDIINNLHAACGEGKTLEAIRHSIDELVAYTKTHFKHEEEYLEKIDCPNYDLQVEQHEKFISKIDEFQERFDNGTMNSPISMFAFLSSWLVNHIQKVDVLYAPKAD
ncbi:MAG: bacteriohemerythrin [Deferribacteraceae bacterium]|jgi:hemerythrin-like metal-binding protein|nr:bacteriohemerythrin [Deferribacteraceae bacterium]